MTSLYSMQVSGDVAQTTLCDQSTKTHTSSCCFLIHVVIAHLELSNQTRYKTLHFRPIVGLVPVVFLIVSIP